MWRNVLVVLTVLALAPTVWAATGERNCNIADVPFAIDANNVKPQFMGWATRPAGQPISIALEVGNTQPGQVLVIEANGLPSGMTCQSGTSPALVGTPEFVGIYYVHLWVYVEGSPVKTDFNQSVFVFRIIDGSTLPYFKAICGP